MREQLLDIAWSVARTVVVVVLPFLAVVCFVAGIVLKGKCPVWLLVVAAIVPLGYGSLALLSVYEDGIDWWALVGMWMVLALGLLIWAMIALRQGRSYPRLSTLLGLAMSLPVAAFAIYLWVSAR